MSSCSQEKKRAISFSQVEKEGLKQLVFYYKDVVENKKTDGVSIKQKNEAWKQITDEFNSMPDHTTRTEKQLRKCWDNLKTEKKKALGSAKRAAMGTGGGPPVKIPKEDEMDAFTETFATEIEGGIDSDTVSLAQRGNDNFFVIDESSKILQPLQNQDTEHLTIHVVQEDEEVVEDVPADTPVQREESTPYRRSRTGINKEMSLRARRVQNQIENDKIIHGLLLEEARYKVEAAKELAEERRILKKKAMVELELRECQLNMVKAKENINFSEFN